VYLEEDGTLYVDGEAYSLTFEDEFEGTELDMTKWSYCPEWKRQDLECYWENDCTQLRGDGNLTLTSEYRNGKYYMGAVRSKGKFTQTYGYFETRCTLNTVPGYWMAFWLMGETVSNENGSGVDGTEIDIMETAYFGQAINHALHWDGYGANHKSIGKKTFNSEVYDGEYHTFSLLWTETEYIFFIDGEETWRTSAEEAGGICEAPLYLKLTTETGSWTASSLDTSKFPTEVYVDYVRVYEKKR
ncbi:MAG: glycoside hydrolase family 16 protein, partial [Lachnospiraceae bacterium]|nr:glycoside hydrolase family 16 protein [Lachnospiraceae bacterium]